jgi:hypothetical protein
LDSASATASTLAQPNPKGQQDEVPYFSITALRPLITAYCASIFSI